MLSGRKKNKKSKKSRSRKAKGKKNKTQNPALNLAQLPNAVLDRILDHLETASRSQNNKPGAALTTLPAARSAVEGQMLDATTRASGRAYAHKRALSSDFELSRAALALTCRALRLPAERHLFRSLHFTLGARGAGRSGLLRFQDKVLTGNPGALVHVKNLCLHVPDALANILEAELPLLDLEVQMLRQILCQCSQLGTIKIDLFPFSYGLFARASPQGDNRPRYFDTFYDIYAMVQGITSVPIFHARRFCLHSADLVPKGKLSSVILDIDYGPTSITLHESILNAVLAPRELSAEHVTVRNLVCHDNIDEPLRSGFREQLLCLSGTRCECAPTTANVTAKESDLARRVFGFLGAPESLTLERCRLSSEVFTTVLDTPLASSLVTLELHEIVRMRARDIKSASFDTAFPLDRLRNLKHLRLGAVDGYVITGVPPSLESATFLVVNSQATFAWLRDAVSHFYHGPGCRMQLPMPCTIHVRPRIGLLKNDGPDMIVDVTQRKTVQSARAALAKLDTALARQGRTSTPMTFVRAFDEGSAYISSAPHEQLEAPDEQDTSIYQGHLFLWQTPDVVMARRKAIRDAQIQASQTSPEEQIAQDLGGEEDGDSGERLHGSRKKLHERKTGQEKCSASSRKKGSGKVRTGQTPKARQHDTRYKQGERDSASTDQDQSKDQATQAAGLQEKSGCPHQRAFDPYAAWSWDDEE